MKNSKARNLNSDASNLNFMARSFYKMPTCFFAMHSMDLGLRDKTYGKRNMASEMRENVFNLACDVIYIRYAKRGVAYGFSDV